MHELLGDFLENEWGYRDRTCRYPQVARGIETANHQRRFIPTDRRELRAENLAPVSVVELDVVLACQPRRCWVRVEFGSGEVRFGRAVQGS